MTTTLAQRQHLAELMDLLVQHEPRVHYRQARPMLTRSIRTEKQLRDALTGKAGVTMDCSESVTLLCRLAGLADPSGLGYNGTGYTGTMLDHLTHYSEPYNANVGALVVFGPRDGEHVCMVRTVGDDPILFSHGQESGPAYVRFSVERAYHRAPARFLSITKLG